LIKQEKPDRLLILGDTNSGLAAIIASRVGVPVYHLEAGNRCYDNRVPEEINRRLIDHSSDVLLPYTERSAENLVKEGIQRHRIFVVGNPILEVIESYKDKIESSKILNNLGIKDDSYFVATMHRAENVDPPERLSKLVKGLIGVAEQFKKPVILSVHPRTADRLCRSNIKLDPTLIRLEKPFGLFDFIKLEKNATVQEEACIFRIPNVTIRDVTERPETIECGSNMLAGADPKLLCKAMELCLAGTNHWSAPVEYLKLNVAATVARIMLSYR